MGTLLTIIGFGWALIGIINFANTNNFQTPGNEFALGFSLMLHVGVYLFPGLVVGSLGLLLRKKRNA